MRIYCFGFSFIFVTVFIFGEMVVGRREEEFFEALEHSDRVLDEELEGSGWIVVVLATWVDASRGAATFGRSSFAERERYALRGFQWADPGR